MASIQPIKTVTVELSHPHSLRLLKELEQVNAIKLIKEKKSSPHLEIPDWHKPLLDERIARAKNNPESMLDFDVVMKEIENGL